MLDLVVRKVTGKLVKVIEEDSATCIAVRATRFKPDNIPVILGAAANVALIVVHVDLLPPPFFNVANCNYKSQ